MWLSVCFLFDCFWWKANLVGRGTRDLFFHALGQLHGFFVGGGQNEGIFGMTYEVVGPTGNATLRVNMASMMAPGFLRKIFEFRNQDDSKSVPPYSSPTR